jgi:hypothetical protein
VVNRTCLNRVGQDQMKFTTPHLPSKGKRGCFCSYLNVHVSIAYISYCVELFFSNSFCVDNFVNKGAVPLCDPRPITLPRSIHIPLGLGQAHLCPLSPTRPFVQADGQTDCFIGASVVTRTSLKFSVSIAEPNLLQSDPISRSFHNHSDED